MCLILAAMPTYDYICAKCGHRFDLVQRITDKALTTCPRELCPEKKWGKGKVKRAIGGGGGLIFKGSGFYITDYRSEKYKEAAKKDAPPAPAAASDSKSDSKPAAAAKTESKAESKTPKKNSPEK
jgi:putative FmdB family regulatory protein